MKRQQQGLDVPNSDSANPAKSFIQYKYHNRMVMKKLNMIKYFAKALLELRDWGFSEEEVIICANITAAAEKLIVWNKAMTNYREGDAVYIEFKTVQLYMVDKWEVGDTGVKGGVTNGVAKVK